MGDIGKLMVGFVAIAVVCLIIAGIGSVVVNYWPILLIIIAGIIGGVVYMKRQKRAKNMV